MFSGLRRLFRRLAVFRTAAILIAVIAVAAACSSDGYPTSYDDQKDIETGMSNVETNWMLGCSPGLGEELAEQAVGICECSYARIRSDVPFEDFLEFNDRMADNPAALLDQAPNPATTGAVIVSIVSDCIAGA